MKKELVITTVSALLLAGQAMADDASMNYNDRTSMYRGNEFSIEGFGTDAISQYTINHPSENRVRHDSTLGVGVGANYFLLPFLGVGGEAYSENARGHFVDDADGSLIVRIPIGQTGLAPYAFGGGGHKFDPVEASYAHAGGGLEFRFTPNIGIFVDARYVFMDKIPNYGLGRAGIRIAF